MRSRDVTFDERPLEGQTNTYLESDQNIGEIPHVWNGPSASKGPDVMQYNAE